MFSTQPKEPTSYRHFRVPFPKATGEDTTPGPCCRATVDNYICTRRPGHEGSHQAIGTNNDIYAEWD